MQLSIVIPIHNEEPSILPLYDRLTVVLEKLRKPYEIIFIDDASSDRSFDLLANLVETDGRLKVIRLRRNFGQTAALAAGFGDGQACAVHRDVALGKYVAHPRRGQRLDQTFRMTGFARPRAAEDEGETRHPPSLRHRFLRAFSTFAIIRIEMHFAKTN